MRGQHDITHNTRDDLHWRTCVSGVRLDLYVDQCRDQILLMREGRLASSAGVSANQRLGERLTLLLDGDVESWAIVEISNEAVADLGPRLCP